MQPESRLPTLTSGFFIDKFHLIAVDVSRQVLSKNATVRVTPVMGQ